MRKGGEFHGVNFKSIHRSIRGVRRNEKGVSLTGLSPVRERILLFALSAALR